MPEPVIFKDLPATFPEKDRYKKPSVIGSIVFHGLLIFVVIIVPLHASDDSRARVDCHACVADRAAPSSSATACGAPCNNSAQGGAASGPIGGTGRVDC